MELLFAEVVELMAPAVWPAPAAAFVLVESVARDSRRRWRSGGGRDRRATGTIDQGRPNSATTMVGAWLCSLRAFALNDQQKTTTVYFNRCPYARAREASGGNNSEEQGDCQPIASCSNSAYKESCSQKGVYAPAIGLCKDPTMTQSKKPSNADF